MTSADILTVTERETAGPARVLELSGELDRDSRHLLSEAGAGADRLVLDLGGLSFCDSSGLSTLVDLHRQVRERGGWVRLAAPSPMLRDMLEITNLSRLFDVYDSVDAAFSD